MSFSYRNILLCSLFTLLELSSLLDSIYSSGSINIILLLPFWFEIAKRLYLDPTVSLRSRAIVNQVAFRSSATPMTRLAGLSFVALVFMCFVRGAISQVIPWSNTILLLYIWLTILLFLLSCLAAGDTVADIIHGMTVSLCVYLFLNIALLFLGVSNSDKTYVSPGSNVLLGLLGLKLERAVFPLGGGLNNVGVEAAIGIAVGTTGLIRAREALAKLRFSLLLIGGVGTTLLADSRGAAFFALLSIVLVLFLRLMRRNVLKSLPLTLPLLPFAILGFNVWAGKWSSLVSLSRGKDGFLSLRDIIWGSIINILMQFKYLHVVGYGLYGQIISGAYNGYASVFELDPNYNNANTKYILGASAHNSIFQLILDVGYVGATLYIVLLYGIIANIFFFKKTAAQSELIESYLAGVIYIVLIGNTELVLYYGTPILFAWFLAGVLFLFAGSLNLKPA